MALRRAAEVARRGRSTLTVAYVNDPLLVAAAAAALHDRRLAQRSARELQEFIDRTLSTDQRAGIRIASNVSLGNPADEIMRIAARKGSDLIVLGTHGLTGADRLLLGSTTLSVLQKASVPVLAVPRSGDGATADDSESWPGRLIVAAVELDEVTDKEIGVAARLAEWFGSSLLLVHVIADLPQPAWLTADFSAHERARVADAQRRLEGLAARVPTPAPAEARVLGGAIADELAGVAARMGAGLIVTSLRDRRAWFGARRGSISYRVLSHAATPVLALPSGWPRAVRKRRA